MTSMIKAVGLTGRRTRFTLTCLLIAMGVLGLAERGNAQLIGNAFLNGCPDVNGNISYGVDGTANYAVFASSQFEAAVGYNTLSFMPGIGSPPLDLNNTVVYLFQITNNGSDSLPIDGWRLDIPSVALTSWGYFSHGVFGVDLSRVDASHNLVAFTGFSTWTEAIDPLQLPPLAGVVADTAVDSQNKTVMTALRTDGPQNSVGPGQTSSLIVYTASYPPGPSTARINDGGTCGVSYGVPAPYAPPAQTVLKANAGADQAVNEGTTVTLDGSGSTGDNLQYFWTKVAGPNVVLDLADPMKPTFIAPTVPDGSTSQTLSFQLTVKSGSQSDTDPTPVNVVVSTLNQAPVANAGTNQQVNEGATVTLDGHFSYDADGPLPLTYLWAQTGGVPVTLSDPTSPTPTFDAPSTSTSITLTFTLTVSDSRLSSISSVTVTVENVNHPPVANAGHAQTVGTNALVTLDGSPSSDPDGDTLTYSWTQVGGPQVLLTPNAGTVAPSFVAPAYPTQLTFNLAVTDVFGAASQNLSQVVVTVDDAPRCDRARAVPEILWPPDHKLREIRIVGVKDPNRKDQVTIHIDSITQNEAVNGLGDGDTSPDGVRTGDWDGRVLLRSERGGKGDGRGYTVTFTATDSWGLSCSGQVWVGVPHHDPKKPPVHRDGFEDSERH